MQLTHDKMLLLTLIYTLLPETLCVRSVGVNYSAQLHHNLLYLGYLKYKYTGIEMTGLRQVQILFLPLLHLPHKTALSSNPVCNLLDEYKLLVPYFSKHTKQKGISQFTRNLHEIHDSHFINITN